MANAEPLPAAFDPVGEAIPFLARIKARATTKFSRTKQASLDNATRLAYWLYVCDREDEALEVCRFLGTYQFAGNFNLLTGDGPGCGAPLVAHKGVWRRGFVASKEARWFHHDPALHATLPRHHG